MGSVVDRYFMFVIHDAAEKWQPIWHCGWSAAALLAILLVIGNVEQNRECGAGMQRPQLRQRPRPCLRPFTASFSLVLHGGLR